MSGLSEVDTPKNFPQRFLQLVGQATNHLRRLLTPVVEGPAVKSESSPVGAPRRISTVGYHRTRTPGV